MKPWVDEARRLRAAGDSLVDISRKVGKSLGRVQKACRGVECPVDHRHYAMRRLANRGRIAMEIWDKEFDSVDDLP
jgi:hypothetical protein